ncbi:peptide ABC transporter substrate-binding protein [Secundilactobacillus oryzae]|uniref:peptide ABC transporter substrate-binding protein n=1 Tax=Secundilactobacillus oryzae TaxID=1202668 RepID=UPI0020931791|nr:peptide ABC transporter substrate-binding protein [Secundilactobacillus oryzae]
MKFSFLLLFPISITYSLIIIQLINQLPKKFGSTYGTSSGKIVTNGPYKLVGWNGTSTSFKLKKNPKYTLQNVRIPTVNVKVEKDGSTALNLFKANKVQITQLSGQLVKSNANNPSLKTTKILRNAYLEFNGKNKTTNNTNLHKAISYVLDREQLTKSVLQDGSVAAWSMVPQGDASNPTTGEDFAKEVGNKLKVNTKAAKVYWRNAQSELGKKRITVQLLTGDDDASKQVGEYMQAVLKKELPGLNLTLKTVPQAQHIQMGSDKNYEINLDGWSTGWYDPADFLQMAEYGNALSFSNWKDAKYQKLISQINDTTKYSTKQRYDLMLEADRYLMQQQGIVPLYQSHNQTSLISDWAALNYSTLRHSVSICLLEIAQTPRNQS